MELNSRLKWAVVWGLCFFPAIVIFETAFRTMSTFPPERGIASFPYFVIAAIAISTLMITFALCVRGYEALATKYGLPFMWWCARILSIVAGVMAVSIIFIIFEVSVLDMPLVGTMTRWVNVILGLAAILYAALPICICFAISRLAPRIGSFAYVAAILAIGLLCYAAASFAAFYLFEVDPPKLIGSYIWAPVAESIFIAFSTVLFWRIART